MNVSLLKKIEAFSPHGTLVLKS